MSTARSNITFAVWDLPVRLFHWLLVAAIAVAFLSSEGEGVLAGLHYAAGWTAAVLVVFRLVWGFVGGEHARFINFILPGKALSHIIRLAEGRVERSVGHNPAGGLAVLLLIGGVGAVVLTGLAALQGGEEDLHEGLAWLVLGFIGVHVAAVIATSIISRENLVRAMVTGRKKVADHEGAAPARKAGIAALLLALAAAVGAVAGIRHLDPQAFSLQQREGLDRESHELGEAGEQADDDAVTKALNKAVGR